MIYEPSSILLVEDEEAHAELTVRAIRKAGNANRIDTVPDGEKALDYLFNRGKYSDRGQYPTPGLVLLDIKLPGADGIEVLKKSKRTMRSGKYRWLCLLLLSGPRILNHATSIMQTVT